MKKIFLITFFIFFTFFIYGQSTGVNNVETNSKTFNIPLTEFKARLFEPFSNTQFYLDTACVYVTAMTSKGDTLWRIDPWKDNNLETYKTDRPKIKEFDFYKTTLKIADKFNINKGELIIWIEYDNTQYGIITITNGKFYYLGIK
jgi:hypothetical protein